MARILNVSTEVFAAIWAKRQEGEETEDAILARLLGCSRQVKESANIPSGAGVIDDRNGVKFPEGFQIFRTYKRLQYSALAQNGGWLRVDNGKRYLTLNQLNASIAAGAENVWNGNWKYRTPEGAMRSIGELRR